MNQLRSLVEFHGKKKTWLNRSFSLVGHTSMEIRREKQRKNLLLMKNFISMLRCILNKLTITQKKKTRLKEQYIKGMKLVYVSHKIMEKKQISIKRWQTNSKIKFLYVQILKKKKPSRWRMT